MNRSVTVGIKMTKFGEEAILYVTLPLRIYFYFELYSTFDLKHDNQGRIYRIRSGGGGRKTHPVYQGVSN